MSVSPDLGPNCMLRLSAEDTIGHRMGNIYLMFDSKIKAA